MIWDAIVIVLRAIMIPMHIYIEKHNADWLPWWRRYASVPFTVGGLVMMITHPGASSFLSIAGHAINYWNSYTARNNRNNDRNMRKIEAARAEQTAVQAAAWRREVVEAQ